MTKYVEDRWSELKTHVTMLVSDKSTETTEKLEADLSRLQCKNLQAAGRDGSTPGTGCSAQRHASLRAAVRAGE
eukprot:2982991-Prymnesium_polylepis.1